MYPRKEIWKRLSKRTKINYVWWKITNKSLKERCGNKIGKKKLQKTTKHAKES
jgi:hypothetical protein